MKDAVRVILVAPGASTRGDLQRQIRGVAGLDLVEVCTAYGAAVQRAAELRPGLMLVVVDDDQEQALDLIGTVARGPSGAAVLPAGSDHDPSVIMRMIRAGAREFLPLPADLADLSDAARRLCPDRDAATANGPRGPQVIAVTGAAGGVGCTTLAVNLATTLAKLSRRDTVLADFDLLLGSLEECLAVIPDNSLEVVIRNLDDFDPTLLKRWLPRHQSGVYVLPHPVSMEEAAHLDPEGLKRVIGLLKEAFDSVVIDTSKGLQHTDFLAFEAADVILVTLELNLNSTRNTVRLLQYFRQFDGFGEKVRLVVNRVDSPLSEISLKKAEELLKTPIHWQIPNATKLFRPARTRGLPIDEVEGGAGSKAHEAILGMARELQPYPPEPSKARKRLFSAFR